MYWGLHGYYSQGLACCKLVNSTVDFESEFDVWRGKTKTKTVCGPFLDAQKLAEGQNRTQNADLLMLYPVVWIEGPSSGKTSDMLAEFLEASSQTPYSTLPCHGFASGIKRVVQLPFQRYTTQVLGSLEVFRQWEVYQRASCSSAWSCSFA